MKLLRKVAQRTPSYAKLFSVNLRINFANLCVITELKVVYKSSYPVFQKANIKVYKKT